MSTEKALQSIIRMMEKREEAPAKDLKGFKSIKVLLRKKKKPEEEPEEELSEELAEAKE